MTSLNYSYITELNLFSPELGNLLAQPPLELMGNTVTKLFESTEYSVRSIFPVGTALQAWQGELQEFYFSQDLGKPHEYYLFTWAVKSVTSCALRACLRCVFFSLRINDPLLSQRDTEESFHSRHWATCIWVSLPSHYAHCPQPPPLIDLGLVPASNCLLQIGFALDCWLLSSHFSLPCCALPCPPLLISWVVSEALGLIHQHIPEPQELWWLLLLLLLLPWNFRVN